MQKKITNLFTENELQILAKHLAKRVNIFPEGGRILFLNGEIGAGKTTFTRFFSQYLGNKYGNSPTFSVLEEREFTVKNQSFVIFHGDFYRICSIQQIQEIIDQYQEREEMYKKNFPEKICIWILEWFPKELISEFFEDVPKIFLDFSHCETNKDQRKISLYFSNPFSTKKEESKMFLEKYKTPVHIKKHIEMVRKISHVIGQKLQKNKIPLDIDLVENSALLHDAVKYVDFPEYSKKDKLKYQEEITKEKLKVWKSVRQEFLHTHHANAMAEILKRNGFFATAKVVASHNTTRIFSDYPMTWEEKIVYYADKRALHDTFVSVKTRLEDGLRRYPHEKSYNLEKKIFDLEKSLEIAGNFSAKNLNL